nr:hypothetical protein [uncultured Pseudodesulfovibrio sp.]
MTVKLKFIQVAADPLPAGRVFCYKLFHRLASEKSTIFQIAAQPFLNE